MAEWALHLSLFVAMFALPCALFVVSTIVARELRDFFMSTALSLATHLILSAALLLAAWRLEALLISGELLHLAVLFNAAYALSAGAWLLGATGCLFGDQAPSNRIGPRGIKRYR